jgi:isocitrate dehydrogenase
MDKVNPGSLILSGAMMVDYMGWKEAGTAVRHAVQAAIKARRVTYDLARQIEGAQEVKCSEFAAAIVAQMQ